MNSSQNQSIGVPTQSLKRDQEHAKHVLSEWISSNIPSSAGFRLENLAIPEGSGVSSETLIVSGSCNGVPKSYVVKCDTPDGLYMHSDLRQQYDLVDSLKRISEVPVPVLYGFESNPSVLGQAFYVMECVAGKVPADNPPFNLSGWVASLTVDQRRSLFASALENLVKVHQVDVESVAFLARPARGRSGFDQEFNYYLDYGEWAAPEGLPKVIREAVNWLKANYPEETPTGLSWGDARLGNMVFHNQRCCAVLDWEMVSLGGAELDLAWWACMDRATTVSLGIPRLEGIGSPAELVSSWQDVMGREAKNMQFYLVFNAYRLAVIVLRLSRMLKSVGRLPAESEWMLNNNTGMQYLATMLSLEPAGEITQPWPGLE